LVLVTQLNFVSQRLPSREFGSRLTAIAIKRCEPEREPGDQQLARTRPYDFKRRLLMNLLSSNSLTMLSTKKSSARTPATFGLLWPANSFKIFQPLLTGKELCCGSSGPNRHIGYRQLVVLPPPDDPTDCFTL